MSCEKGSGAFVSDTDTRCAPEDLATVYFVAVHKYSGTPRCLGQYPTKCLVVG